MKKILSLSAMLMLMMAACSSHAANDSSEESASNSESSSSATAPEYNTNQMENDNYLPEGNEVKVKVETTAGDFTVMLYNDTPKHRDNFVKLAEEGFYDGTLFHRVIKDFMVQAGDPDSRNAKAGQMLGSGDPGYTLEAEIVYPRHFHKRGALAAARQGDQVNPQRRSSGSQFYVVTGAKTNEEQLKQMLSQSVLEPVYRDFVKKHMADIQRMQQTRDMAGLQRLDNELQALMAQKSKDVNVPEDILQAYTTVGGAPHLDGQYTVFGEVIDGMDVIDKIEGVQTDGNDRPLDDVRILKMTVLK